MHFLKLHHFYKHFFFLNFSNLRNYYFFNFLLIFLRNIRKNFIIFCFFFFLIYKLYLIITNSLNVVVTAIQGLIDAADEELKLRENSTTDPSKVRV